MRPVRCGFKCPHESDANSPCDVYAFSVSQHRAKEILDDPPLKAFVDRSRKRYGKAPINYPQPTEVQTQKLESYDAYRETLFAKGKAGKGGSAQAGLEPRPRRLDAKPRRSLDAASTLASTTSLDSLDAASTL